MGTVVEVEADVVFQNVDKALSHEHALEEGGVVGYQLGFVVAVLRLPFHESLKFRGDGASLALGKVGYHAEGVVAK